MEHNHTKKKGFLALLIFIITLPFMVLGLLIFGLLYVITTVIPAPIEVIIYRTSDYYKELRFKYTFGITKNFGYRTYKYVKKNPELEFVRQPEGYYYYKAENAVFVMPYYAGYYYENGKWMLTMDEGKQSIEISEAKNVFAPLIKEDIGGLELKLLVKEKYFRKDQLCLAKSDPVFVFYKNHKDFANIK